MLIRFQPLLALAVVALPMLAAPARAEEAPAAPPPPGPTAVRVVGADGTPQTLPPAPPQSDVQRYCANIADPALDARNALQLRKLGEAEAQVSAKIDELERKRAEVQSWLAERKGFLDSTSDTMLAIYAAMKPDAAAAQLAGLDREVAASLVARLKSRQASAILTEMPANVAAELGALIVSKTDRTASSGPQPDQSL